MQLLDFYQSLVAEAFRKYEPVWTADPICPAGNCWSKTDCPYPEQFRIAPFETEPPVLVYSLVLPERYLSTTIYEEIRRYPSAYDLSIVVVDRKVWINVASPASRLKQSIMGFVNRARGEAMDILDGLIELPDPQSPSRSELAELVSK